MPPETNQVTPENTPPAPVADTAAADATNAAAADMPTPEAEAFTEFDDSFAEFADKEMSASTPESEPASEPEPAPEPAPDLWANATEEQKAAFEAATADAHKWKSNEGRHAADARRIAELESQITSPPAGDGDDPTLTATFESEDWKAVESELPELAAPLKLVLEGMQAKNRALETELSTFSDERRDKILEAQKEIVSSAHSNWEDVTDDNFVQWVGSQPNHVRAMFNRNAERIIDGEETAHLVTLYKQSDSYTAPTPPPDQGSAPANPPAAPVNGDGGPSKRDRETQRRLEGNTNVPSRGPGAPSGPPDEYDDAFDHYAAQGA